MVLPFQLRETTGMFNPGKADLTLVTKVLKIPESDGSFTETLLTSVSAPARCRNAFTVTSIVLIYSVRWLFFIVAQISYSEIGKGKGKHSIRIK